MKDLISVCIDDAAKLGYGEYRTHIGKLALLKENIPHC